MKKFAYLLWIFILIVELISLYIITSGISEITFDIVLIAVTLVVGVTTIFAFKENV